MEFLIRSFQADDFQVLESMMFALYREDSGGKMITHEKIGATIQEFTKNPMKGQIYLVYSNSPPELALGYFIIIYYWSNEFGGNLLMLDEIYLTPTFRRQGIGSQIIEEICNLHRDKALGIQLEISPMNTEGWNFYQKNGFKPIMNEILIREF